MPHYVAAILALISLLVSWAPAQTFSPEQGSVFFGGDSVGGALRPTALRSTPNDAATGHRLGCIPGRGWANLPLP